MSAKVGRAKRRKTGVKHKANRGTVQVRRWLWETMVGQVLSKVVDRIFTWVWAGGVIVVMAVMAWLGFFTVSVTPRISSPGGKLTVSVRVFPAPTIPVRR